jgi:hypothetical protein
MLGVFLLCGSESVQAADLFRTDIDVGVETSAQQTNSILDVPDLFDTESLGSLFAGYDPSTDPFVANLDLRGLPTRLVWIPTGSGGTLAFTVLGETVRFTADTLDEAVADFEDWLSGDLEVPGSSLSLTKVLQGLVELSPVDPVAGNPNSLQSRMFQTDYNLGSQGPFTTGDERLASAPNQWELGFDYGYGRGGPYDVQALDLPLGYRWNFRNPKWSMLFSLPLSVTFTERQWSVLASGGVGFQYRPTDWWALTTMARVGGAGSIDVGALAVLYSVSLTNHMRYQWRGLEIAMTNLGGFSKTIDGLEIGGYDFSYELSNPILTNGGSISGNTALELRGRPLAWRFFGSNTQVFGDAVYMDSQSEVGLGLAVLSSSEGEPFNAVSLSLSYVFGNNDYDGLSLRARFRF